MLVAVVYGQAAGFEFLNYDDGLYVTDNPHIQGGDLVWAFTRAGAFFYHFAPLTYLSHMLDCRLFGLHPGPHHLVNVLLHLANTLLLFEALRRLTAAPWRSAFVAALFALHPLHVETVAWISERKDLLCAFFAFAALIAYNAYARRRSWTGYGLACLFFALGLMCKSMLVTLPFLLLLLDYWPLRRVSGFGFRVSDLVFPEPEISCRALVIEKIPFFLLSGIAVGLALRVRPPDVFPVGSRFGNALVAYVFYIEKTFWPAGLAPFYPYPESLALWKPVAAGAALCAISAAALLSLRSRPYLAVGWFAFAGMILPTTGLIPVGAHAMADRYTYVPLVGVFLIVTWLAADIAILLRAPARGVAIAAVLVVAVLGTASYMQTRHWRDSRTLFEYTLRVTERNALAHNNLGLALAEAGQPAEAVAEYEAALRIQPDYADAHNNLGVTLFKQGRSPEALAHYLEAFRRNPSSPEVVNNLAIVLVDQKRYDEAVAYYEKVIALEPESIAARVNMANALALAGRAERAATAYREAAALEPNNRDAHFGLAAALAAQGDAEGASREYREAVRCDPGYAPAHNALGVLWAKQGRLDEAIREFEEALRIDPNYTQSRNNLEHARARAGQSANPQ